MRLNRLNASRRSWSRVSRLKWTCFNTPRLKFAYPGPSTMLRPALPNVPKGGIENAAVLNQCAAPGCATLVSSLTFGRSLAPNPREARPVLLSSKSGDNRTVKGRPLCSVRIPLTAQFASRADAQPWFAKRVLPDPNGISHVNPNVSRCRRSKLDRPHSASGLLLSCGKFGSPVVVNSPEASSCDEDQVYEASAVTPIESR